MHTILPPEVELFDCEQGSEEWRALRMKIPTASRISDVMAGGQGNMRRKYLRQLAGEIITGLAHEEFKNAAMKRGNDMEPELRRLYSLQSSAELTPCGFARRTLTTGSVGCSPDSLIGSDGVLEIKSATPELLIEIWENGVTPSEHIPQCQCSMLVLGRKWCDLAIGYSGMPLFRRRIQRDPSAIRRMEIGLEIFNNDLAALVERIRAFT